MDLGSVNTLFSLISFGWQSDFLKIVFFLRKKAKLLCLSLEYCARNLNREFVKKIIGIILFLSRAARALFFTEFVLKSWPFLIESIVPRNVGKSRGTLNRCMPLCLVHVGPGGKCTQDSIPKSFPAWSVLAICW